MWTRVTRAAGLKLFDTSHPPARLHPISSLLVSKHTQKSNIFSLSLPGCRCILYCITYQYFFYTIPHGKHTTSKPHRIILKIQTSTSIEGKLAGRQADELGYKTSSTTMREWFLWYGWLVWLIRQPNSVGTEEAPLQARRGEAVAVAGNKKKRITYKVSGLQGAMCSRMKWKDMMCVSTSTLFPYI